MLDVVLFVDSNTFVSPNKDIILLSFFSFLVNDMGSKVKIDQGRVKMK